VITEQAGPDAVPFKVLQDLHAEGIFRVDLPDHADVACMFFERPVRKIDAGDLHSRDRHFP
jgi:hypothetical protein